MEVGRGKRRFFASPSGGQISSKHTSNGSHHVDHCCRSDWFDWVLGIRSLSTQTSSLSWDLFPAILINATTGFYEECLGAIFCKQPGEGGKMPSDRTTCTSTLLTWAMTGARTCPHMHSVKVTHKYTSLLGSKQNILLPTEALASDSHLHQVRR